MDRVRNTSKYPLLSVQSFFVFVTNVFLFTCFTFLHINPGQQSTNDAQYTSSRALTYRPINEKDWAELFIMMRVVVYIKNVDANGNDDLNDPFVFYGFI